MRRKISNAREKGRWEVEAEFHVLVHEVQQLAHEYNNGNQNVVLLEDTLEWELEEAEWLCTTIQMKGQHVKLFNVRLTQAKRGS